MAESILPQIRCRKCNRLLLKGEVWRIEIKCPKCGYLQMVAHRDKWPLPGKPCQVKQV